jgi:uncharacterized protein YndB with AHSA1/START domain
MSRPPESHPELPLQVAATVLVNAPVDSAFRAFTGELGAWWPPDFHLGERPLDTVLIEGRVGGRLMQRAIGGGEAAWGRVIAWEPPRRLALAWQLDPRFDYDPDPAHETTVEVAFTPEPGPRSRVELSHRHLDRHGEEGVAMRDLLASAHGWPAILERFQTHLNR